MIEKETPRLEDVIRQGVKEALFDLHTSMPGEVLRVYPLEGAADIRPCLQRRYEGDSEAVELPVLNKVPISFPESVNFSVKFPIEIGDPVWIQFSERSLEVWKETGGCVDPNDSRKHHLSDCVAFPGTRDLKKGSIPDAFEITGPNGIKIRMTKDGKFKIFNGTDELIGVLFELIERLVAAQIVTGIGPQPFLASTITEFEDSKTKMEGFKE